MKSRDEALALLYEFTKTDSLRKHALAVEQAMKACAKKFAPDDDPVRWGICGLLHDFDYESYPTAEQHPFVGSKILEEHIIFVKEALMEIADEIGVGGVPTQP